MEEFKIIDIQFGDIITLRNGERYVYASKRIYGEYVNYESDCDMLYRCYDNNLKCKIEYYDNPKETYDIVKIERQGQVIYRRKEGVVKMTLSEVCEKLGYDVKIIEEC